MAEKVQLDLEIKVDESIKRMEEMQNEVASLRDQLDKTGKQVDESAKGINSLRKGVRGVGLALKAVGIGLLLKALAGLTDAFTANQVIADKVSSVFLTMKRILGDLINAIQPFFEGLTAWQTLWNDLGETMSNVGSWLKDQFIDRILNSLNKSFLSIVGLIQAVRIEWNLLTDDQEEAAKVQEDLNKTREEFAKLEKEQTARNERFRKTIVKTSDSIFNLTDAFGKYIDEVHEGSEAFVEMEKKLRLMEAQQQLIQLTYQKDAEIQRQIRDDVSLTMEKRIEANDKLGKILDEQLQSELELAKYRVEVAEENERINGKKIEHEERLLQAQAQQAEVEERITGQRSEQLTNLNSLLLEQRGLTQELSTIGTDARTREAAELDVWYEQRKDDARRINGDLFAIELEYETRKANMKAKFAREDKLNNQKKAKDEIERLGAERAAKLQIASSVFSGLHSLAQLSTNNQEKLVKFQKASTIAQLAIDSAAAISKAIVGAQTAALGTGVAAPFTAPVLIANAIATTLGAFVQAKQLLSKANGPSAPSLGSAPSFSPPDISGGIRQSNAALGVDVNTENEGAGEASFSKTYVLSKDVTSRQELDEQLKRESVI